MLIYIQLKVPSVPYLISGSKESYLDLIFAQRLVIEPTLAILWHHATTLQHKPQPCQTMHEYKLFVPPRMLTADYGEPRRYVQEI